MTKVYKSNGSGVMYTPSCKQLAFSATGLLVVSNAALIAEIDLMLPEGLIEDVTVSQTPEEVVAPTATVGKGTVGIQTTQTVKVATATSTSDTVAPANK